MEAAKAQNWVVEPQEKKYIYGLGMELATHVHLVPCLRMLVAILNSSSLNGVVLIKDRANITLGS
jgi:hypothetical protein